MVAPANLSSRAVARTVFTAVLVVLSLYLIYLLRKPIGWLLIATFLAIALSGPVNFLNRRMKRGFAIALVYLGLLLVPIGIGAIVVPPIVDGGNDLAENAPAYADDVTELVEGNSTLRDINEDYDVTEKIQEEAAKLPSKIGDAAVVLRDVGFGVVNSLFALVTILILTAFILGGGRGWIHYGLRFVPEERAERLERVFERVARAVGNYVAGALAQATIAALTAYIVLSILGVPFAAPLALLIFFLDLIPLIGATIGAVLVGVVTLFEDFPTATIIWTVYSILYQQIENNLIQPRIQSRAVSLEPFLVVVSVLFGSTLFGIMGALLAVPVAAAIQVAIREYIRFRRGRFDDPEDNPRGPEDEGPLGEGPSADPAPAPT
jgi:predicted PurR-regulated permease PerM